MCLTVNPPSLQTAEIERRKQIKKDATVKYEKAIAEGNMEDARKYAQQTTSMKDGMVKESKQLLTFFRNTIYRRSIRRGSNSCTSN